LLPIQLPANIYLVEDHEITALGVQHALTSDPRLKLIGIAQDGEAALMQIPEQKPDVVILDLSLPKRNGIHVTKMLRSNNFKGRIIWFSAYPFVEFIECARTFQVNGYVSKGSGVDKLLAAVIKVCRGDYWFTESIFCDEDFQVSNEHSCKDLTNREKEVLVLLSKGYITKEIAEILKLSVRTIDTYRAQICKKVPCRNLADMVRFALKSGISR
jgi:two-component system response regulator NreC